MNTLPPSAESDAQTRSTRRNALSLLVMIVVAAICAALWLISADDEEPDTGPAAPTNVTSVPVPLPAAPDTDEPTASEDSHEPADTVADIPSHVTRTLAHIDAGRWPDAADAPGTRGGQTFRNNERLLPQRTTDGQRITYQEWDVNPKERGRSRDAERIVTGSDGTAWYTDDHYRSFVQIRGPSR